ncbi:3-oxoacyl-[acyl-carrier-protein] synthase I [Chlorella vulgaris]
MAPLTSPARVPEALKAGPSLSATRAARPRSVLVQAAAAQRRTDPKKRVVITGMGLASCFGNDVDHFYNQLLEGVSGVDYISRFDASNFPTKFAAQIKDFDVGDLVDKKNARRYDDCLSYTMVASKKALQAAGLEKHADPEGHGALDKTRVGVLVGSGMGGLSGEGDAGQTSMLHTQLCQWQPVVHWLLDTAGAAVIANVGSVPLPGNSCCCAVFQDGVKALVEKGHKKITPFFIPYAITNMGGALLAIDQGFMGPNYSISTACATANYAFVSAANHIRNGDADVMVAGGSEAPIIPVGLGGFVACRALSQRNDEPQRASRPWDDGRDGFVMGEGAGVLVMESLEHAQKRGATIIAEYLGGAVTCDAHHMTDPHPDGLGVSTCIELALKDSGIERDEVNYINAHATSTLVGDKAEVKAIKKVFTDLSHIKMNATKSMIGHCLGAAGGMEAIATIQAMRTGWVHPTINHESPIEEVDGIDVVANTKKQHDVNVGISNSFGFGGHNSVCAFGKYIA